MLEKIKLNRANHYVYSEDTQIKIITDSCPKNAP